MAGSHKVVAGFWAVCTRTTSDKCCELLLPTTIIFLVLVSRFVARMLSKSLIALALTAAGRVIGQLTPSTVYQPPDPTSGYGSSLSASTQWSNLLGNMLWFYEAQRSGRLPSDNRVSWRNDSCLTDGQEYGVDLTGGYYDAGGQSNSKLLVIKTDHDTSDYIKATYPLAFSIFSVCWGANTYGDGYANANQTAYLDQMLRWGLDWLMKAHPGPNTVYIQAGDDSVDNNYWGGDQDIPSPRPVWQVNSTITGTDIAARMAAAFASCSALYNGFSITPSTSKPAPLSNSTYASTLLNHATQLYSLSQQTPLQTYTTAIPGVDWAYASSSYQDEQALAAVMMSVAATAGGATSSSSPTPQSYLDTATDMWSSDKLNQDVVLNWDSVSPAVPILLTQIASLGNSNLHPSGGSSKWQGESETYLDRVVNENGRGYLTKGGLLWYSGDSDLASLNPAMNAAMLLFIYAPMATSSSKTSQYQSFAQGQWDYALGKNPMSAPYVVGSNPNSPTNPHDAKSSGGSDIDNIDTSPVNSTHILYGAAVGGPNSNDQFWNIRSDWPETEVALDYNAPFLTLAAYSVLKATDPPFYTSLAPGVYAEAKPGGMPCDPAFPCKSHGGLSTAAKIVLAVVITVVGLIIAGLLACFLVRAKRGRKRSLL
ncbi:hypothetical protein FRB97_001989 [Tulasnella sp. 331]|nr:hypothetical protein FRB97_001989 [Tulasnella sp. 331]